MFRWAKVKVESGFGYRAFGGYYAREHLKALGFRFNAKQKTWDLLVASSASPEELKAIENRLDQLQGPERIVSFPHTVRG